VPSHTNAGTALRRALAKALTDCGFEKMDWYFVRSSHIKGLDELVEISARRFTDGESGTSVAGGIGVRPGGRNADIAPRNRIMILERVLPDRQGDGNRWWTFCGEVAKLEVEQLKQLAVESMTVGILEPSTQVRDADHAFKLLSEPAEGQVLPPALGKLLQRQAVLAVACALPSALDLALAYQASIVGTDYLESMAKGLVARASS
jgi:hypothetical protein